MQTKSVSVKMEGCRQKPIEYLRDCTFSMMGCMLPGSPSDQLLHHLDGAIHSIFSPRDKKLSRAVPALRSHGEGKVAADIILLSWQEVENITFCGSSSGPSGQP